MAVDMTEFNKRLEFLLKIRNIKRAEVSRRTGIPDSTIRQWIKGSVPNIDAVSKIAEVLEVTTDFLINGSVSTEGRLEPSHLYLVDDEKALLEVYRALQKKIKKVTGYSKNYIRLV